MTCFFRSAFIGIAAFVLILVGIAKRDTSQVTDITIGWKDNILSIYHPQIPGGKIDTWYLEAYCRPGSTDRPWNETTISHRTELVSINDLKTEIKLKCTLEDGVRVDHLIRATRTGVSFDLIANNPTGKVSEAHWAQPCIRVGKFTGQGADETDDAYAYIKKSFIFQDKDDIPDFLPTKDWATKARYVPGQVWCPKNVNRDDVNPRPLHPSAPHKNIIGCVSADKKWLMASVWEPYQELFQGVIRCIHSDFRIGGLKPGETKKIRGKMYLLPNDVPALLALHEKEFPDKAKKH
ncbi:hypothetical protein OAF75_01970 [Verrucomicrobiales bacterium]|nr:hypothetical protein [Verrucomicrobiales bacterium]MDB4737582.1 hypothetical protein [Verrucomicrobiales bacterium]